MSTPTPSDDDITPPWWLKPMNKVFMAMMKIGLPIAGKEGPVVLTTCAPQARRP